MSSVPLIELNSGAKIPQLGLGVFQVDPSDTKRVVLDALEVGYRHIDTAAGYNNETAVGEAIAESGIDRSELYITTKQRPADQAKELSGDAIKASLEKLGLPFVDLYLIHWPTPARGLYVESWQALERFAEEGLTRSIGVSNFLPEYLDRIAAESSTTPAVNQIELHPELQQRDVEERCLSAGIRVEAWSPIARGALVDTPEVHAIAQKYGKTVAQVTLRWHIQHGRIIIPRTVHKARMVENFDLFDFGLEPAEVAVIDALDCGKRVGSHPATMNNV
ncbi:MAG: aldo/keto reductase [Actinobacteria bacterium]|nr:aldo/keto reductase [Actinomycetota bacterium]